MVLASEVCLSAVRNDDGLWIAFNILPSVAHFVFLYWFRLTVLCVPDCTAELFEGVVMFCIQYTENVYLCQ